MLWVFWLFWFFFSAFLTEAGLKQHLSIRCWVTHTHSIAIVINMSLQSVFTLNHRPRDISHILHFSRQSAFSAYFVSKIFRWNSWLIILTSGIIIGRKIITLHLNMISQLRALFYGKLKLFPSGNKKVKYFAQHTELLK